VIKNGKSQVIILQVQFRLGKMRKSKAEIVIIVGSDCIGTPAQRFGEVKKRTVLKTPYGKSSPFYTVEAQNRKIMVIYRHGDKKREVDAPFVNYRANIYASKELGASRIMATSAVGSIDPILRPGDIIIPNDLIDATRRRAYTFYGGKAHGFIRFNPVFCPEIRQTLIDTANKFAKRVFTKGTCVVTDGPRLETPAEIKMFKLLGADVVSQTISPEVFLARELEICYGAICNVVNYAEGTITLPRKSGIFGELLPDETLVEVENTRRLMPEILKEAAKSLPKDRDCPCKDAMDFFKKRKRIPKDWHKWISPESRKT
jgi:5'-methylthioadenosine phosphorylase